MNRRDLTRWNRAGLERFRYVDSTAAEYLEILRQQLVKRFVDQKNEDNNKWLKPFRQIPVNEEEQKNETLIQRHERLNRQQKRILEMYHQDRRDWAWEITRTFARSCHMLTKHINAYANEAHLGTATQWDNVRQLVGLLDYYPAPPASANTRLAFIAKEDKPAGTLPKGFQVKYTPPQGGPKVIFETLEDLNLDPALNQMQPKGWNKSEQPAIPGQTNDNQQKAQYSSIANLPVKHLQGVGETWAKAFTDRQYPLIKDLVDVDPSDAKELGISETRLREFKAKATGITRFSLESGWSDLSHWILTEIVSKVSESLSEMTGFTLKEVKALQLRIELIGAYLDHDIYKKTKLVDLLAPSITDSATIADGETLLTPWIAAKKPKVVSGQVAMVVREPGDTAQAVTIVKMDKETKKISVEPSQLEKEWTGWPKGEIILHVSPRWKKKCWLNGNDVIRTEAPHGFTAGVYISWKVGKRWEYAKIIESDKRNLRLKVSGALPDKDSKLIEVHPLKGPNLPSEVEDIGLIDETLSKSDIEDITVNSLAIPDLPEFPEIKVLDPNTNDAALGLIPSLFGKLPEVGNFVVPTPFLPIDIVKMAVKIMLKIGIMVIPSSGKPVFEFIEPDKLADFIIDLVINSDSVAWKDSSMSDVQIKDAIIKAIPLTKEAAPILFKVVSDIAKDKGPFLVNPKGAKHKAIVSVSDPFHMFDGKPEDITEGQWAVARFKTGLKAVQINLVNKFNTREATESFSLGFSNTKGNEGELVEVYTEFKGNLTPKGAKENLMPVDPENIELKKVPESLRKWQTIILSCHNGNSVSAKVTDIKGNIILTDAKDFECSKGKLSIFGNVVMAGHGQTKPVKILGSGNASVSGQEFILEVADISFVPDSSKASGVVAAIDVWVDTRLWEQVFSLKDSTSSDHHYAVRMTEDGYVKIMFGDGQHGRRLPSGKNNIRVQYRVGSGRSGNILAGGLQKAVNPHPLIDKIIQPQRAAGGGEMEDTASLREKAPATLLALERAVCLADFAHLASAQTSIWQAKAYKQMLHGKREQGVKVVIVPVDGAYSDEIGNTITNLLQQHVAPGVAVSVCKFDPVYINLNVTIKVDFTAYVATEVEKAVGSALADFFKLENRKLGEHLYLSEVYKVVENIRGVESSICVLNGEPGLQLVKAENQDSVVHLDTTVGATLLVKSKRYKS